jgi:TrmH family RNA methyltransferase
MSRRAAGAPELVRSGQVKIKSIASESNSTLKTVRTLHKRQTREKEQLFLLEGPHCLLEALKKDLQLKSIVASETYMRAGMEELHQSDIDSINVVPDKLFADLVTTTSSCGVLAIAHMPKQERGSFMQWQPRVFAVADAVQDPGNLGTIIRTALAAQLGGLLILKGSVDLYNPKVVRAAAGALFSLPILSDIDPQDAVAMLKTAQVRLIICEASGRKNYFDANLKEPVALALGNEGQGTSAVLRAAADESVSIPMNPESESLNVAISGGIILFESLRQRLNAAKS